MQFGDQLGDFARYMTEEQGLSPQSVRSHCWKTSKFLTWFGEHHRLLMRVGVEDVDEFLAMKGAAGWNRKSVSVAAQALRPFFRFAETRGWCATGLAKAIQSPRIYQYEDLPEGPTEKEVRQLLHSVKGTGHAALRTRAILMLFSVYGLRSGEVSPLLLSDFDWRQEMFVVNHSKRGGSQRYPLQHEVGNAILHYLKEARPRCACRHLFVTAWFRQLRSWKLLKTDVPSPMFHEPITATSGKKRRAVIFASKQVRAIPSAQIDFQISVRTCD